MGDHDQNYTGNVGLEIPRLELDPALGQLKRHYVPRSARLWPEQLRAPSQMQMDVIVSNTRIERAGYDLLAPGVKSALMDAVKNGAGPNSPEWLSITKEADEKKGGGDDKDKPPFFYARLQYQPPGTGPQATLQLTGRGRPSLHGTWDAGAAALAGTVVLTLHDDDEAGWEFAITGQGNMSVSTNPQFTGVQATGSATYVVPLVKKLQFQGAFNGTISHDFVAGTTSGVNASAALQYDLTERIHATGGATLGLTDAVGGSGPPGVSTNATFMFNITVDTDMIRFRRKGR